MRLFPQKKKELRSKIPPPNSTPPGGSVDKVLPPRFDLFGLVRTIYRWFVVSVYRSRHTRIVLSNFAGYV